MGREWYRVGGGGGGRSSKSKGDSKSPSCGGENSRSKSVLKETSNATIAGCMNTVFHLFDFHHFHFPVMTQHHREFQDNDASLPHQHSRPKGVEAPRNSLESTEEAPLSPIRRDNNLNLYIKTKPTRSSKLESLTSNESYSPSTKTPTLVARLMGLDLLPDKSLNSPSSPTPSCSSALSIDLGTQNLRSKPHSKRRKQYSLHRNSVDGGTRSLPETPRISLGRRSDADCYQQRRLSLHINKDMNASESEQEHGHVRFSSSRLKEMKTNDEKENRSPREYARQIVMQLKESVSRRMGTDITNTARNKEQARDHHHHHHHHNDSKKASKNTTSDSSPRLRFSETQKAKPASPKPSSRASSTNENNDHIVEDKTNLRTVEEVVQTEQRQEEEPKQERETRRQIVKKCKKQENDMKFGSRLVKPPPKMQEEPFVRSPMGNRSSSSSSIHHHHHNIYHHQGDKKCKKTPLLNDLLNFTSVPSLLPIKKDPSNLYVDALKVTETQQPRNRASELLSCPSQTRTYIVRKDIPAIRTSSAAAATAAELDYITRILRRTGIDNDTPISYAKWFSPSHPLDPSIFYFLEHFAITSARTKNSPEYLGLRCNRKLLFHLVDEILIDVLKPHMNIKPWVSHYSIRSRRDLRGSELIDELYQRIKEFPLSDCQVLEDIDVLVYGDLPDTEVQRELAFEEEGEGVVAELERQIIETLLSETTTDCIMGLDTSSFERKVSVSRGRFT